MQDNSRNGLTRQELESRLKADLPEFAEVHEGEFVFMDIGETRFFKSNGELRRYVEEKYGGITWKRAYVTAKIHRNSNPSTLSNSV